MVLQNVGWASDFSFRGLAFRPCQDPTLSGLIPTGVPWDAPRAALQSEEEDWGSRLVSRCDAGDMQGREKASP